MMRTCVLWKKLEDTLGEIIKFSSLGVGSVEGEGAPWSVTLTKIRGSESWALRRPRIQEAATSKKTLSGLQRHFLQVSSNSTRKEPGHSQSLHWSGGCAKLKGNRKHWGENNNSFSMHGKNCCRDKYSVNTTRSSGFLLTPIQLLHNNASVINLHQEALQFEIWEAKNNQREPEGEAEMIYSICLWKNTSPAYTSHHLKMNN